LLCLGSSEDSPAASLLIIISQLTCIPNAPPPLHSANKPAAGTKYAPAIPDPFRDDSPDPPPPAQRAGSGGEAAAAAAAPAAAAVADDSGSVFQLPAASKAAGGKVRNIDKMLEQLKKWVVVGGLSSAGGREEGIECLLS